MVAPKFQQFDPTELAWVAFGLDADRATGQLCAVVKLWVGVLQNGLSLDQMTDGITSDLNFDHNPLITPIGLACGGGAVRLEETAFHDDMGARGAEIGSRTLASRSASQELDFDRVGKILVEGHALGSLTMQHEAVVSPCPARTIRYLIADESVFCAQTVVGERFFVEEMAECLPKFFVLVV